MSFLERGDGLHGVVQQALAFCNGSRAGGFRRDVLFPRIHVAAERLSREDPFSRDVTAPKQRLYRNNCRKLSPGVVCGALWLEGGDFISLDWAE